MSRLSMRTARLPITLLVVIIAACNSNDSRDSTRGEPVVATPTFGPLDVPVGVALVDPRSTLANRWCASFEDEILGVGDTVTLVWADSSTDSSSTSLTQVHSVRPGRCARLPGDTSDIDDPEFGSVYELALVNAVDSPAVPGLVTRPALAVRSTARWTRGPDGLMRADVDGDENPEQARICNTHEAVHLTLWTLVDSAAAGRPREHRRWRAYQSLGYDVEPSCTERETEDPPEPAAATG